MFTSQDVAGICIVAITGLLCVVFIGIGTYTAKRKRGVESHNPEYGTVQLKNMCPTNRVESNAAVR